MLVRIREFDWGTALINVLSGIAALLAGILLVYFAYDLGRLWAWVS